MGCSCSWVSKIFFPPRFQPIENVLKYSSGNYWNGNQSDRILALVALSRWRLVSTLFIMQTQCRLKVSWFRLLFNPPNALKKQYTVYLQLGGGGPKAYKSHNLIFSKPCFILISNLSIMSECTKVLKFCMLPCFFHAITQLPPFINKRNWEILLMRNFSRMTAKTSVMQNKLSIFMRNCIWIYR